MTRTGVQSKRRGQLIAATIEAIHENGFCDVTVGKIARGAGVSYGLAHHYFGSKDQLLTATMRHLLTTLGEEFRVQLATATTSEERVRAVVRTSFSPLQFQPVTISAWLAFYMQAHTGPRSRALLRIYASRLRSNLCHALTMKMQREKAVTLAEAAAGIIDGLWIRWALNDNRPSPEEAADYAEFAIKRLVNGECDGR